MEIAFTVALAGHIGAGSAHYPFRRFRATSAYGFCMNDSVRHIDPLGLEEEALPPFPPTDTPPKYKVIWELYLADCEKCEKKVVLLDVCSCVLPQKGTIWELLLMKINPGGCHRQCTCECYYFPVTLLPPGAGGEVMMPGECTTSKPEPPPPDHSYAGPVAGSAG